MALIKGQNSYADVAEFDAYLADRLDSDAAKGSTPERKAAALVSATDALNEMSWVGTVVAFDQPLAFPRYGTYFDPRLGGRIQLSGIPARITKATFDLATHLLSNEDVEAASVGLKELAVGSIDLKFAPNTNVAKVPSKVLLTIKPLKVNSGSSIWWRAN